MDRFRRMRPSLVGGKPYHGYAVAGGGKEHVVRCDDAAKLTVDSSIGSSLHTRENLFEFELKHSSSKQVTSTPMKTLIAEEMSKESEVRKHSPSVIARLMGLDPLPTHHLSHKQKKKSTVNCYRRIPIEVQEKHCEEFSFRKNININDPQEFKDVYEVLESSKDEKHNNWNVQKPTTNSRLKEEKLAFIRQKFIDAKRLSTDENLRHSKEFHDALEVLDSNKDLFLRILQEPDSLFAKHLDDLQAPIQSGHITVLKSSKASKYHNNETHSKFDKKTERQIELEKHISCTSHRLVKSRSGRKAEESPVPTRIVVLKPSLGMVQDSGKAVSLTSSMASSDVAYRKHKEVRRSGNRELFPELRSRSKFTHALELARQRSKGSREIAREVTRQMRQSVNSGLTSNTSSPGLKEYASHERSYTFSGRSSINDFEVLESTSRHFFDRETRYSPSSSHLSESHVSKEARKRLSERFKMTRRFQDIGSVGRSTNTLGEMLAFHDQESLVTSLDASRDRLFERWPCPSGISSRDGWKDVSSRNLPRSRSLPSSSTLYESPKMCIRTGAYHNDNCSDVKEMIDLDAKKFPSERFFNRYDCSSSRSIKSTSRKYRSTQSASADLENYDFIREIHITPDELRMTPEVRDQFEEKPLNPDPWVGDICNTSERADHIEASDSRHVKAFSKTMQELLPEGPEPKCIVEVTCGATSDSQTDLIAKETSSDLSQVESQCHLTESESSQSLKEVEQPSPVSILEPPFEEEISSSECFEKVSADLHGLRMQLQLLKLEAVEASSEGSEFIVFSDEDTGEGGEALSGAKEDFFGMFKEENRNFCFVLDVLVASGLHASDQNVLFTTCYTSEFPVNPDVFEQLENKYRDEPSWLRPERRLLFDQINSGLAQILGPCMDQRPWLNIKERRIQLRWRREALAEEVCELLSREVKERKGDLPEKSLGRDIGWMELSDDTDVIGRELERFLMDELIEDVFLGLSFCNEM